MLLDDEVGRIAEATAKKVVVAIDEAETFALERDEAVDVCRRLVNWNVNINRDDHFEDIISAAKVVVEAIDVLKQPRSLPEAGSVRDDMRTQHDAAMRIAQEYHETHWRAQPSGFTCHCPTCVRFREIMDKTPGDPRPDSDPGACRGGNEGGDSGP